MTLQRASGLRRPRLAVTGVNPHAGEDGLLGDEENSYRAAGDRAARGAWHRCARAAAGRHTVSCRGTQDLRRRAMHVSRSGPGRDQDAGLRPMRSTSRSACRSCAPRRITAPPSISRGPARANPASLIASLRLAARLAVREHVAKLRPPDADDPPLDGLPPLRDVIRKHDLIAKKSLGQNFLLDLNLTGRIARAAGPRLQASPWSRSDRDPGGLTRALLSEWRGAGDRGGARYARDCRALQEIAGALPRAAYGGRRRCA